MGYDSQLRLTRFTGAGRTTEHDYYNDGRVKEVRDLYYGGNFLRKYEYDQAARLTKAHAGGTAQTAASPYSLNYGYDEWGHTTSRTGSNWSNALANFSTTYTNNHDNNMKYDPAGNVKNYASPSTDDAYTYYDAANRLFTQLVGGSGGLVKVRENYADGEGKKVYYKTNDGSFVNGSYTHTGNYYYIRSSVLGGAVVAEYNDYFGSSFTDSMSYVYLQGEQLAFQQGAHQTTGDKYVVWTYHNPVVGSYLAQYQLNNSSNQPVTYLYGEFATDPLGSYVGLFESQPISVPEPFTFVMGQSIDIRGKCYADYVETPCTVVQKWLNSGVGQHAPLNQYDTRYNPDTGQYHLTRFTVDWDNGFFGFVPVGAKFGNSAGSWYDPASRTEGSLQKLPSVAQVPSKLSSTGKPNSPCDQALAGIFGGAGAVMTADYDISGTYRGYYPEADAERAALKPEQIAAMRNGGVNKYDREHLYWFPHLYGNEAGTKVTDIYIPAGYSKINPPVGSLNVVTVNYKELGGFSNVTLAIMHVDSFGVGKEGNRTRIGRIGGPGGKNPDGTYAHAHFQLWKGKGYLPPGEARDKATIPVAAAFCSLPTN